MKTKLHIALGALLAIALFVVALPISSAAQPSPVSVQERGERRHVKQGPEVGKRVKQLQKFNKDVRSALADFEKNEKRNGHRPKHDESFSITMDPAGGPPSSAALKNAQTASPFRKASFKPQDPDYSGYGVEMIFIPTYDVPGEWQGTVIINKFDPSGAYLGQYVADVAMVPDPTQTFWDVQFEVSYEGGSPYLQYGDPALYSELGMPGLMGEGGLLPAIGKGITAPRSFSDRAASFEKASFTPQTPWQVLRFGNRPTVRFVMKCTALGTAGAAVRCGIGSLATGGTAFLPCTGTLAAGILTVCTLTAIFS